jgi:putative transposase
LSVTLHCAPAPFNRFFRGLWKPERANTNTYHRFRRNPNLLKAGEEKIRVLASEQVWVADITYLPTQNWVTYLSLVTDDHSRKVVGYHVHDSLDTAHVSQALRMALRSRQGNSPVAHHADQGIFGTGCWTFFTF